MGASRNLRALVPASLLVPSLLALSPAAAVTVGGPAAHAYPASTSSASVATPGAADDADDARVARVSAIVFWGDRGSPPEAPADRVFVLEPATGAVTQLAGDDESVARMPALSPDGRQLAWVRLPLTSDGAPDPSAAAVYRCTIGVVAGHPVCSAPVRVVGPVAESHITWTADSRSVIYSGQPSPDNDTDLFVVDAAGGPPRNLTSEPVDGQLSVNNQPAVSPDGDWVYYSRGAATPTAGDLYRVRLDGSGRQQLTAAPFNDNGVDVSPDGRRLMFHANRDGGDFDIWTMRAAPESASNPARDLTAGLTDPTGTASSQERRPTWSPDGTRVAFWWFTDPAGGATAGFTDSEIYVMRPDGSRVRDLTANNPAPGDPPPATLYSDLQPDWGRLRLTPVT